MAITTVDEMVAAAYATPPRSQNLWQEKSSVTCTANVFQNLLTVPGITTGSYSNISNTTTGIFPDDTFPGAMPMNDFGITSGITNIGTLSNDYISCTVTSTIYLSDLLFAAGPFAFNASSVSLSSQPSYVSRLPRGSASGETKIMVEAVTAFTGTATFTVSYTNQAGTSGRTATLSSVSAPGVGRCYMLPFQSGDTGVLSINSVTCTGATAGTFNVYVLRDIAVYMCPAANFRNARGPGETGGTQIFDHSCLLLFARPSSTSTGLITFCATIIDG